MVGEDNDAPDTPTGGNGGEKELDATGEAAGGKESLLHKLCVGTGAVNIVGNRYRWCMVFATLVVVCIVAEGVRGFKFGIDFAGGTQIQFPAQGVDHVISSEEAASVVEETLGEKPGELQEVGTGEQTSIQIRSEKLSKQEAGELQRALFEQL